MADCLGLYIEEHLIKYAKVSKEHDNLSVKSFGVMFYDKIEEAIQQIIEETYSHKTPISINLSEEMYNYFDMFALLRKNDLQKAIKTEFDSYCSEKGYNSNVFETRYAIVDNQLDKEKLKIIHIAENKIELNKIMQQIEGYRLINVSPLPMSIPNLIDAYAEDNCAIVNIEDKTTITTIINKKVSNIDVFETGSTNFLTKINAKENSYSKAYEICKNTTIYTSEGQDLQLENGETHLEDIMPTLFEIVEGIKKTVDSSTEKISKIYITGTGALINNVDLYFQEYLLDTDCEILKPYFIDNTRNISIKDYIEVNSAISLAMMGLGEGIEGMNFKKSTILDKLPSWLTADIGKNESSEKKSKLFTEINLSKYFNWDLGQSLDTIEINLIRGAYTLLILIIVYSVFSSLIAKQIKNKSDEAEQSINATMEQIQLAEKDNNSIQQKISEYTSLIETLEETNNKIAERTKSRNMIPNLLNQLMTITPENVQLTSIENTMDNHIVIEAQSDKYEQLGYLKAKIKTDVILTNVLSTSGQKEGNVVTVRIEGDIP